jgi:LmbE family N-acetylglucosaminyl deacetylase
MKHKVYKLKTVLLCVAVLRLISPVSTSAQVRPVNDYGAIGIEQLLNRLNTTASVMMIGAHPDDEDSALLAYLARGENARTAYLSLTRGDGGQNIIGPELFESLGVIRTEELMQARRLDGAEQYFTRAYDYGFSKTLAEAKQKWDEKVVLCDAVKAIRLFRPMVVISRFTGTPADGHGHHQFAGYLSPIAVKAAADPGQCSQAGPAWQVLKFYVEQGFGDNLPEPTVRVNTGQYDPALGRTYFEVAMEGRSQHRSQGEGRLELHGAQYSGLNLIETKTRKAEKETGIFDGINTTIAAADDVLGLSERPSYAYHAQASEIAERALKDYRPSSTAATAATLVDLYKSLSTAEQSQNRTPAAAFLINKKMAECAAALRIALGVQIDALADKETAVPGEDVNVAVKVFTQKNDGVAVKQVTLKTPSGWQSYKAEAPKENAQAFRREAADNASFFTLKIPRESHPTQPYWLRDPRDGDLFRWPDEAGQTLPFEPQPVSALVSVEVNGTTVTFEQPLQFRYAESVRGEIRRNVDIVPQLSVTLDQKLLIVPESAKPQTRRIVMSITNNSLSPVAGVAALNFNTPTTWKYSGPPAFNLKNKGDRASIPFDVTVPANVKAGTYEIYGQAMVGEALATSEMNTIAYPHIQTHRFYTRAETQVDVLDLKVPNVKVGYIMGSGDEVPDAIKRMGLDVTMLEEKDLASGDLSGYDTIVVGIRASETRPDMMANKDRLIDYVKNGGNLIMQYQRGNFAKSGLPPYPVDTQDKQGTTAGSIARVVDENAPVKILEPQHQAFNSPNKITDADFAGWVQERNSYNLVTFDPKYAPLLESHDSGEQENKGGLVIAKVGKGNWIYCSYSFFRQLPAGVSGAYRLFANLISTPH